MMRDFTPQEAAIEEIVRLLAPALTHGQGMAAREREDRFRKALGFLTSSQPARPDHGQ